MDKIYDNTITLLYIC